MGFFEACRVIRDKGYWMSGTRGQRGSKEAKA
jgi:hypothetical protein